MTGGARTAPLLSVCIPTHHGRCALLEEALESIAPQLTAEVELVVSDNASQDGTEAMIERFRARHPDATVVYGRNERDVRLQNIMRVVERARGDWCWLFGSDDRMAAHGVATALRAIARLPDVSGFGFAKANFSHDMQVRLAQDVPAFYPSSAHATVYRSFEAIVLELAFQFGFLGSNIVRRSRWLAAADRAGPDVALRHPDWPQLVVFAEMARRDPVWAWLPDVLVQARAGRPYLVEDGGPEADLTHMHVALVDGLRDVWPQIAGRGTPLQRALMHKSYVIAGSREVVRNIKRQHEHSLARDARLLASFTRAFWRLADFRRDCLPLLLVPAFVDGSRPRSPAVVRRTTPLTAGEIATEIRATVADGVRPHTLAAVSCVLTNRGAVALRCAPPYPVAVGFRWADRATGTIVLDGDRVQLPRPLGAGETIAFDARIGVPAAPGDYELRISPVQELVVWFDDLDPANGARISVTLQPG